MNAIDSLSVIDVAALVGSSTMPDRRTAVARALDSAARTRGFFYAINHGVEAAMIDRLVSLARAFFAQSEAAKMQIPMSAGGRAWRGYFPLSGELTSNRPDWKKGPSPGSEVGCLTATRLPHQGLPALQQRARGCGPGPLLTPWHRSLSSSPSTTVQARVQSRAQCRQPTSPSQGRPA